ncbi:MAG: response regulator [Gammaproteobacteria bacterium]
MLLERAGATVITAADGFEALSVIAGNRPDVVFVDVMMPRLDGYQTCALVKGNPAFRATPVVMLSSRDGLFDIAKGRVVGSEEYITKPFTRDELIAAVKRHAPEIRPLVN